MAESELLAAFKALQTHIDSQLLASKSTVQEFMSSIESRLAQQNISPSPPQPSFQASSSRPLRPTPSETQNPELSALLRTMKMEVPRFDGSDPSSWAFRIEEFFDFHNTPEHLRLRIVSFHMDGRAARWFQWMKANHLLSTWPVFLHSLKHRFGSSVYADPQGALSKLTQTSSVAEFQSAFEDLMNQVQDIPESLLISFFIIGLKPAIRRELSISRPDSLMEVFSLARAFEARFAEARIESYPWSRTPPRAPHTSSPPSTPPPAPTSRPRPSPLQITPLQSQPPILPTPSALPIRRFSAAELR